jgi:electron transport complex protein RnfB
VSAALSAEVDALLPQTQCTRCGFEGCGPYAAALASGQADINRCPPGGDAGIRRLAALLGRPYRPLDPECGMEQPRHVAFVDEARCIGCTLCIQACPADAILGAPGQMHTVLTDLCSGCDLCVAPCPVDCIAMLPAGGADAAWDITRARAARQRFDARKARQRRETRDDEPRRDQLFSKTAEDKHARAEPDKRAAIQAAIERASARRAAAKSAARQRQGKSS